MLYYVPRMEVIEAKVAQYGWRNLNDGKFYRVSQNYVSTFEELYNHELSSFYTRRNSLAEAEYSVQTHAQKDFEDEF